MKLINGTKQHLKNSLSHYVGIRLKFRSGAFAGTAMPADTLVKQPKATLVRH